MQPPVPQNFSRPAGVPTPFSSPPAASPGAGVAPPPTLPATPRPAASRASTSAAVVLALVVLLLGMSGLGYAVVQLNRTKADLYSGSEEEVKKGAAKESGAATTNLQALGNTVRDLRETVSRQQQEIDDLKKRLEAPRIPDLARVLGGGPSQPSKETGQPGDPNAGGGNQPGGPMGDIRNMIGRFIGGGGDPATMTDEERKAMEARRAQFGRGGSSSRRLVDQFARDKQVNLTDEQKKKVEEIFNLQLKEVEDRRAQLEKDGTKVDEALNQRLVDEAREKTDQRLAETLPRDQLDSFKVWRRERDDARAEDRRKEEERRKQEEERAQQRARQREEQRAARANANRGAAPAGGSGAGDSGAPAHPDGGAGPLEGGEAGGN
ncbi:MAG: hypothetical protein HY719_14715 [Planctomycetes bacterium]|nr:hypothetical protein [Planctomycetota bacterium]